MKNSNQLSVGEVRKPRQRGNVTPSIPLSWGQEERAMNRTTTNDSVCRESEFPPTQSRQRSEGSVSC